MGRPAKTLTGDEAAKLEALASFLNQDQIADYLGIARNTLAAIMKRDPEILARYKKGKVSATVDIAQSLIQKARDGDTACQIFYLKTQAGWREKDRPEDDDANAEPVTFGVREAKGQVRVTKPE